MLYKHSIKDITWIDLEKPTHEEVEQVIKEYNIEPLLIEELLSPTFRSKVDVYDDSYIYLILHFPLVIDHHTREKTKEVDFIIGKKFIITAHYEAIDPLYDFSKAFEANSMLNKSNIGEHAGFIFYFMLRRIYRALVHELEHVREKLRSIEENIFSGQEREMVLEISNTNRILLGFKEAISVHREVLGSFESAGKKFFGEDFSYYLRSIVSEYNKVQAQVESNRDYLIELRDTNDSLLTTKQNEIMKIFTILAFVTFPLALLIEILNIDSEHNPIKGIDNDFWLIIGIMVSASIGMFAWFKHKNWL